MDSELEDDEHFIKARELIVGIQEDGSFKSIHEETAPRGRAPPPVAASPAAAPRASCGVRAAIAGAPSSSLVKPGCSSARVLAHPCSFGVSRPLT